MLMRSCHLESGETMKAAGLKPIATVLDTSAVLIKSTHPSHPELIELITSRIRGVISMDPKHLESIFANNTV
jgi:ATP phosphoribosyltransferase